MHLHLIMMLRFIRAIYIPGGQSASQYLYLRARDDTNGSRDASAPGCNVDAPENAPNGNMRFPALTLPDEKFHCGCNEESEATTAITGVRTTKVSARAI